MTAPSAWAQKRLLIPRWRSFQNSLGTGELASSSGSSRAVALSDDFQMRSDLWRRLPSLATAAEFLDAAVVENAPREAIGAAEYVVGDGTASTAVRDQAIKLLKAAGERRFSERDLTERSPRDIIRFNSRDPFAWLDLGLLQIRSGSISAAKKSIRIAYQLAPNNRFVLRTLARLLLHEGDREYAHDVIKRSPATPLDPWLVSAELAFADLADRKSSFAKIGSRMLLSGDFSERHISELASSLATLEMGGNTKRMMQLFRRSLADPTDNALAQAAWAEPIAKVSLVEGGMMPAGENEGLAHYEYHQGNFERSLHYSKMWIEDESFSTRPYAFSAATAGALDLGEEALSISDRGLQIDPRSIELHLSQAYALAILGRYFEASRILNELSATGEKHTLGFVLANSGLIKFRTGALNEGLECYEQSMRLFRSLNDTERIRTASAYLAREASLAGHPKSVELYEAAKRINLPKALPTLAQRVLVTAAGILKRPKEEIERLSPERRIEVLWRTSDQQGTFILPKK